MNIEQKSVNFAKGIVEKKIREALGIFWRHITGTKLGGFLAGLGVANASNIEDGINSTAIWVGSIAATGIALAWSWARKKVRWLPQGE